MKMYYISDCCRICLQYDKNLVDITSSEKNAAETLLSKLKVCVSEVEWSSSNLLLCQTCVARLNSSYEFKKQCILSTETWKKYMELLTESQNKLPSQVSVDLSKEDVDDYEKTEKGDDAKQNPYIQVVPNQKLFKLFVGSQPNQNSFQNVFLNLIPASSLKTNSNVVVQSPNVKDTNRNLFFNLNNAFQRYVPVSKDTADVSKADDVNVSQILTESKTEELSVEIDPMDFGCFSEDSPQPGSETNNKDWEEVISSTQITTTVPKLIPINKLKEENPEFNQSDFNGKTIYNNYIPILPKPLLNSHISNEEKYDFFNGGHFLTPKDTKASFKDFNYPCEMCNKTFDSLRVFRLHIKQFHLGKFPYKCDLCFAEFAAKATYEAHLQKHAKQSSATTKDSLTLRDLSKPDEHSGVNGDTNEHACDICGCAFSSANGLLRHKSRKHKQNSAKKKYFIKGMKNARCDICKRDFSTQSYLQLHLKLHQRKGPNYKGKVFKNKYAVKSEENGEKPPENETDCDQKQISSKVTSETTKNPSIKIRINLKNLTRSSDSDESNSTKSFGEPETDPDKQFEQISEVNRASFHDINVDREKSELEEIFSCGTESVDDAKERCCIYCKEAFLGLHNLKSHLTDIHFKPVQYKCHLCNNVFHQVSNLTEHLRVHLTSASCTMCKQMFSDENDMKTHNHTLHGESAFWQCGVCYIILTISDLKEHMQEHDQIVSYTCHFCDDEVADADSFNRHISEHGGLYACTVCKSSFDYEHEKRSHDADVHGKRYFDCVLCGKKYKKMHELTRHRNLHQWHPHLLHDINDRVDVPGVMQD